MTRKNDDELGGRHWLAALSLVEVEDDQTFVPDNSGCPDCHGKGVGCCINADIPLPGVER